MSQPIAEADQHEAWRKQAIKSIDANLAVDLKYPELIDFVSSSEHSSFYAPPESRQPVLNQKRFISLPDNLFEQYNVLQCTCFMGIFPEINRIWITIDHRLFLWNYAEGGEFESFEDLDQVIVHVALVKPKPDLFAEKVDYLLVVATPVDVHLLGIASAPGSSALTILITNMTVSSDNIAMTSIVGAPGGRIFMSGKDGRLWELLYHSEEGWFSSKCSKKEISESSFSYLVPTYFSKLHMDPIVSLAVDSSRSVMYGLTQQSNIKIFDVRTPGQVHIHVITGADILQDAKRKSAHNRSLDDSLFKLISIHVVSLQESRGVCFVAVTSTGCRLYFGSRVTLDFSQNFQAAAAALQLLHVRLAPPVPSVLDGVLGTNGQYKMRDSLYRNGVFLGIHGLLDVDGVVTAAPNTGPIQLEAVNRRPGSYAPRLEEQPMMLKAEGTVWAMTELPGHIYTGSIDPEVGKNEFATQLARSAREFLLLTNSGVSIYSKKRPIDLLQTILIDPRPVEQQLLNFVRQNGAVETCAMCLAILCAHPSLSNQSTGAQFAASMATSGPALSNAKRALLAVGGRPKVTDRTEERLAASSYNARDLGVPVAQTAVEVVSYRHSGFLLYLARLLRPIWKHKVIKVVDSVRGIVDSEVGENVLMGVQSDLFALRKSILEHMDVFTPTVFKGVNGTTDPQEFENAAAEQESLNAHLYLLTQCIEGIAFVLFLVDSKISETIAKISSESQQSLASMTYETLLASKRGHQICRELVQAIINKQMGHHMSVDAVSDTLQRICASFCNPADVVFFKALEHQQLSIKSKDQADIEDNAREALRLFQMVPNLLVDNNAHELHAACTKFASIGFYDGAVRLALSSAQDIDPTNKAGAYLKEGTQPGDSRETLYTRRRSCYDCVAKLLVDLNVATVQGPIPQPAIDIFQVCIGSSDPIFHTFLYDWLLENGRSDILLELPTEYIEEFLKQCTLLVLWKDLLWQFYVKNGEYAKAARELGRIADSKDSQLRFEARLEYLSRAVSNAKSVTGGMDRLEDGGEFLVDLEEKLDVANIQMEVAVELQALTLSVRKEITQTAEEATAKQQHLQALAQATETCDEGLLDVSGLFHLIVEPFNMYVCKLAIFHTSNLDDEFHVKKAWEGFIATVYKEALENSRVPLTEVGVRVKELGRRFYPSPTVTPIALLVQILERYPYLENMQAYEAAPGWSVVVLRDIGFPYDALFDNFHGLLETKKNEWQGARASLVLIQDIEALLRSWLVESHGRAALRGLDPEVDDDQVDFTTSWNGYESAMGGSSTLTAVGMGTLDRFRAQAAVDAIEKYIRILDSANWTPAPTAQGFAPNIGGTQQQVTLKARKLRARLVAIQIKLRDLY